MNPSVFHLGFVNQLLFIPSFWCAIKHQISWRNHHAKKFLTKSESTNAFFLLILKNGSHRQYQLQHFYHKSHDSKPYISIQEFEPLHCWNYDIQAICMLSMCSRACYESDIVNKNHRFPNPPGPFKYPFIPLQLNLRVSKSK